VPVPRAPGLACRPRVAHFLARPCVCNAARYLGTPGVAVGRNYPRGLQDVHAWPAAWPPGAVALGAPVPRTCCPCPSLALHGSWLAQAFAMLPGTLDPPGLPLAGCPAGTVGKSCLARGQPAPGTCPAPLPSRAPRDARPSVPVARPGRLCARPSLAFPARARLSAELGRVSLVRSISRSRSIGPVPSPVARDRGRASAIVGRVPLGPVELSCSRSEGSVTSALWRTRGRARADLGRRSLVRSVFRVHRLRPVPPG
jgi:hypothetical protein